MGVINDNIRRYLILTKRLLRKKSFVAILLLVPILVGALGLASRSGDSGVLTVALAMEDRKDKIAREITETLMTEDGLIRFILCDTPADANEKVTSGEADSAWIFSRDLDERIGKFIQHTHNRNAFVTVIQREESIFLRLSHEKLNTVLYPYISSSLFVSRVNDVLDGSTDAAELEDFYRSVNAEGGDLFAFVYLSGDGKMEVREEKGSDYLVSPLRGLLAIMVMFSGIAAAMFYMQDEDRGAFLRFPKGAGFSFAVMFHGAAVVLVGVAVLAALLLTGLSVGLGREILVLAVYCAASVGFCMCLRLVLRDIRLFGAASAILVVVTAVLCPILFAAPDVPAVQYLLPTYYYIKAFSDVRFLWYMIPYSLTSYLIACVLQRLRRK